MRVKIYAFNDFDVPSFTTFDLHPAYQINLAMHAMATIGNAQSRRAPRVFTQTLGQVFRAKGREHSLWGRTFNGALTA